MKIEKKLIAYSKMLDVYRKADDWILTLLCQNRYERHITDFGVGSVFFIFGYNIDKFEELTPYQDKQMPRSYMIRVLKECINQLKK